MAIDSVANDNDTIPVPPLETPKSFPFPYAKPYGIQVDLMRIVFEAIENGKIAIVSGRTLQWYEATLILSSTG
jgi:chromosome transmission fidelity protein 1